MPAPSDAGLNSVDRDEYCDCRVYKWMMMQIITTIRYLHEAESFLKS